MAFNVSSIDPYVNETASELISKAVATGKTLDLVTILPGVKYKQALNFLDNSVSIQPASCGFTSNGSVSFKQREVEVTALEVKEDLCQKTLEQYWMAQAFKPGAPKENEIGAVLADSYVKNIKASNEYSIWQGNLDSSPSIGQFNGFLALLADESDRVKVNSIRGPFTASTIIAAVDKMVAAIPEAILTQPDLTLFMSMSNYMLYTAALRTANLFHYNGENGAEFETYIPGTSVKAVGTTGLTANNSLVLTYASNLIVATDLANEEEKFDIFYSRDNDVLRVNIQYKMGVQVFYPEFCVTNF